MEKILDGLRQVRASNIIFLFMIPIIIYFLATSRNYLPALYSVLGVENDASTLLTSFLTVCLTATLILVGSIYLLKSIQIDQRGCEPRRYRVKIFRAQATFLGCHQSL